MRNLNRLSSAARQSGGFTLVELLVVIGIIAILAGVALGPITTGIRKARESACMQTTRTLALAEFQYANDNNNYPDGADAGALCQEMITGNYISDPTILRITGGSAVVPTTAGTVAQANVDYNFMGMNGTGTPSTIGINSSAPDSIPLAWSPNGVSTVAVATAVDFTNGVGLFGKDGFAVAYKNNNAFFRTPQSSGTTTPAFPGPNKAIFIDNFETSLTAPTGDTYGIRTGASGN